MEPLVACLDDPYNDPAAAALSWYRWTFADTGFDPEIRIGVGSAAGRTRRSSWPWSFPNERRDARRRVSGKRADMAYWGEWSEDGSVKPVREPSTATLTLAWQVTGEVGYALRALRNAGNAAADGEARPARGAGTRRHGRRGLLGGRRTRPQLGAGSGHGVLRPAAAGHAGDPGRGQVPAGGPASRTAGTIPPPTLLSLVRPLLGEAAAAEVVFHNGGEAPLVFSWRTPGDGAESPWREERLAPGGTRKRTRGR